MLERFEVGLLLLLSLLFLGWRAQSLLYRARSSIGLLVLGDGHLPSHRLHFLSLRFSVRLARLLINLVLDHLLDISELVLQLLLIIGRDQQTFALVL